MNFPLLQPIPIKILILFLACVMYYIAREIVCEKKHPGCCAKRFSSAIPTIDFTNNGDEEEEEEEEEEGEDPITGRDCYALKQTPSVRRVVLPNRGTEIQIEGANVTFSEGETVTFNDGENVRFSEGETFEFSEGDLWKVTLGDIYCRFLIDLACLEMASIVLVGDENQRYIVHWMLVH